MDQSKSFSSTTLSHLDAVPGSEFDFSDNSDTASEQSQDEPPISTHRRINTVFEDDSYEQMYEGYVIANIRDVSMDSHTTLINASPSRTASPNDVKGNQESGLILELNALKRVRGQPPIPMPFDTWKRVQNDDTIQVQQYRRQGNVVVDKFAMHLENTGAKSDGEYQMYPVTSFFVKNIKDNMLVLSGYSVSISKAMVIQSPRNNAKVFPSNPKPSLQ